MTSYTLLVAMTMSLLNFAASDEPPMVSWTREAPGESITIDARPAGSDLAQAQAEVKESAALIDAIRTLRAHALWRKIKWVDGRMTIDLVADSAIHANVATLALRRLFPGRSTAGTGIRQSRRAVLKGYPWEVRFVLAAPSRRQTP